MPTNERPSLKTDLVTRYSNQRVGEAFDVKATLGGPGQILPPGIVIDSISMNAINFQSPPGFEVKVQPLITQVKDAMGNSSGQLSRYMQGFNNTRYYH